MALEQGRESIGPFNAAWGQSSPCRAYRANRQRQPSRRTRTEPAKSCESDAPLLLGSDLLQDAVSAADRLADNAVLSDHGRVPDNDGSLVVPISGCPVLTKQVWRAHCDSGEPRALAHADSQTRCPAAMFLGSPRGLQIRGSLRRQLYLGGGDSHVPLQAGWI